MLQLGSLFGLWFSPSVSLSFSLSLSDSRSAILTPHPPTAETLPHLRSSTAIDVVELQPIANLKRSWLLEIMLLLCPHALTRSKWDAYFSYPEDPSFRLLHFGSLWITLKPDNESEDPGALAAVGCLCSIRTILEYVSRISHLFIQIEPILLPIMRRMLTTDGQDEK